MNYVFEVVDGIGIVQTYDEFTPEQFTKKSVWEIFLTWVHEQELNLKMPTRQKRGCKAVIAVVQGECAALHIHELPMYSPHTWVGLREYHMIERLTADEFIESDVAYNLLTRFEVSVIDGEGDDAWVFIQSRELLYFYSIYCESKSRLLQVLSLGRGKCAPQFFPGLDGYTLDENYTTLENEAWLAWLTKER